MQLGPTYVNVCFNTIINKVINIVILVATQSSLQLYWLKFQNSGYQAITIKINITTMSNERINRDWQCTGQESNLLECPKGRTRNLPSCANSAVRAGVHCFSEIFILNH